MPGTIKVGVLYDFPQGDDGAAFEGALQLGFGLLQSTIELVPCHVAGHPRGTPEQVADGLRALHSNGVVAVVGPSISDNALVVRDVADELELPCINYTGGERTRSAWMFHYQVGSLEEEPAVLAARLLARGFARVGVVYDDSEVGRRYYECLQRESVHVVDVHAVPPLVDDLTSTAAALRDARPEAIVYLGLGAASHALAIALDRWELPVVANSALMFGYVRPDWRDGWRGWEYVDNIADDNQVRRALAAQAPRTAAGPVGCAAYDIGRLLAEAVTRADVVDRAGLREGLERVKQLPATSGHDGTVMGFGVWDRAALKGRYLVLREWRDGHSVQVSRTSER